MAQYYIFIITNRNDDHRKLRSNLYWSRSILWLELLGNFPVTSILSEVSGSIRGTASEGTSHIGFSIKLQWLQFGPDNAIPRFFIAGTFSDCPVVGHEVNLTHTAILLFCCSDKFLILTPGYAFWWLSDAYRAQLFVASHSYSLGFCLCHFCRDSVVFWCTAAYMSIPLIHLFFFLQMSFVCV